MTRDSASVNLAVLEGGPLNTLTEFTLAEGGSILVESAQPQGAAALRPVGATEVLQRAQDTFEAAIDKLRPALAQLIDRLTALKNSPDELEVEFGIKLSANTGAIIAATGAEANFRVKLTWKK